MNLLQPCPQRFALIVTGGKIIRTLTGIANFMTMAMKRRHTNKVSSRLIERYQIPYHDHGGVPAGTEAVPFLV
jgi:citrate synthase